MSFSKRLMMLVSKTTLPNQNSWFLHDVIKVKKTKVYLPQSRFQHGMWIYRKFQVLKMFYFDLWRFQMSRTIYHVNWE